MIVLREISDVTRVRKVHADTKLNCLKSRNVPQARRDVVLVISSQIIPPSVQLTQTTLRRSCARRRVRLSRIYLIGQTLLWLWRVTSAQLVRREIGLGRSSPERVDRQVWVVEQPVDVQAQGRIVRRVIRHKQTGCLR